MENGNRIPYFSYIKSHNCLLPHIELTFSFLQIIVMQIIISAAILLALSTTLLASTEERQSLRHRVLAAIASLLEDGNAENEGQLVAEIMHEQEEFAGKMQSGSRRQFCKEVIKSIELKGRSEPS